MSNHWPVFLALVLLGVAGWFGWQQQDKLQESVTHPSKVKMLPAHYDPNGPAMAVKSPAEKAPAPTMATVPAVARSVPPVVAVPPPVMKAETPPATKPNYPDAAFGAERATVFMTLSAALQQRFNTAPMITNNGYAFVVDGARIDVDATQAWMVTIFNNTKAQPPEHTENFKAIESLVSATLEYDQKTATPRTTPDQKTVWRPMSKLGKIAIEMDPAMFNSVTIKPIQRPPTFVQPQQNPGNAANPGKPVTVQPAQPKQPVPTQPPLLRQPTVPVNPAMPNPPIVKQPVKQPVTPAPPAVNPGQDQF